MSEPVSVHDGPFSTNALPSKLLLVPYIILIWISMLTVLFEFYFYIKILPNLLIFVFLFPFFIIIVYFTLFFTSLLFSKLFLLIVNKIHPPKEGIFRREKSESEYYFWCLRSILKKWTIWLAKFFPSQILDIILLKVYGVKIPFTSSVNNVLIDTEFIRIGKNVSIGPNSYVRSSMIIDEFLIIKSVDIDDEVCIGSRVFISPGTKVNENAMINSYSVTKYGQSIEANSFYEGYPAGTKSNLENPENFFKISNLQTLHNEGFIYQDFKSKLNSSEKSNNKFLKNMPQNILIFLLIYTFSYNIPVYLFLYYNNTFLFPIFISSSTVMDFIFNLQYLFIILFTPFFYLILYFLHLLLTNIIGKSIYYLYNRNMKRFTQGTFHWSKKDIYYEYYFTHSFLMRLLKWKVQRSIFPWITKWTFSYIANFKIGKNTVLEDCYLAKDYLEIGSNCYIGKILLTNHLWGENLFVKEIIIKDNVVISDGSSISPGTIVKEKVTILPLSSTLKSEGLDGKTQYFNTPINQLSEKKLISKYNLNFKELENEQKR
ncbi:MAG: hypothetical protein EU550_00585 [Promethearchaeota archaeon]|nr:MAG: hypothetical protein EU550_00585 [Candidatus Lokiarchaeota archaeon]